MSVSFIVDVIAPRRVVTEPCLCAQMSPLFGPTFRGESDDWGSLAEHADPLCGSCKGMGVERVEHDDRPQVNFANANACIVARALDIDLDGGIGSMSVATLRRGLVRARNVATPAELRAGSEAARVVVRGYSRADLDAALDRLDGLVAAAQRLGATRIRWQ